ncbi:hypothetical protein ACWEIJ_45785 [Lentzea sp. NPDC004789]
MAALLGPVMMFGLVVTPSAAALPNQQATPVAGREAGAAASQEPPSVPPAELSGVASPQRDGCSPAKLRAAADKAAEVQAGRYKGAKLVSCATTMQPDAATRGGRDAALSKARAAAGAQKGDVGTQAYIQPPQFCFDHAFDGKWWGTRNDMCNISDWRVTLWLYQNGVPVRIVGTADWLEINYAYTSSSLDTWAHQIRTVKYTGEGEGNGPASISGFSTCGGDCKQDTDTGLRPGDFATDVNNDGEAYNTSTRSEPGGIGYGYGHWEYWITYVGFTPTEPIPVDLPTVRCDNAIGDNDNNSGDPFSAATVAAAGAGCVFLGILPVMVYSKTGPYKTLAEHIEAAQLSGLPGAYPNGVALNRITNATDKGRNGNTACPPSSVWKRPTGRSCDEYPFRSTRQGAYTGGGSARTFAPPTTPWCEMDPNWGVPTNVTGPTGWSSCMINADDNRSGGAALGAFYSSKRVLDGDAFKVLITP